MSDESLGKFVIDLEARIDKLETDLGRAGRLAERAAKQMQKSFEDGFKRMEEAARRGTEGMMEAMTALTGFSPAQLGIGAVVAGFGELTKKAIETGDQFNKMAQRTGIAVSGLQGLVYAGDLADVSMDTLGTSLGKFAKTVSSAANGSKDQAAAFSALGISVRGADGAIRPMDALVADVADKFSSYRDGVEKTAAAQVLFGKSGATLIPLLNGGGAALRSAAAEAKALGYNFADIAGQSEEFNDNLTRMSKAAVGFGADLARELLPALIEGEERVLNLIKAMRQDGTIQSFARGIGTVVENLDKLAIVVGSRLAFSALASGVQMAAGAFITMKEATTVAAGSFTLFTKATTEAEKSAAYLKSGLAILTTMVAGWQFGSYLEENFLEAKLAGIALVEGVLTAWERLKAGTQIAWEGIVRIVKGAFDSTKQDIANLLQGMSYLAYGQGNAGLGIELTKLAAGFKSVKSSADEYEQKIKGIRAASDKSIAAIHDSTSALADEAIAWKSGRDAQDAFGRKLDEISTKYGGQLIPGSQKYADTVKQIGIEAMRAVSAGANYETTQKRVAAVIASLGDVAKPAMVNIGGLGAKQDEAAKAAQKLAKDFIDLQEFLDKLYAKTGGPYQKAWQEYAAAIDEADKLAKKFKSDGMAAADVQNFMAIATKTATDRLQDQTDATVAIDHALSLANSEFDRHRELIGLTVEQQKIHETYTRLMTAADKELLTVMGPLTDADQKRLDSLKDIAAQMVMTDRAIEESAKVSRDWSDMWVRGSEDVARALGDFASGSIRKFSDFGSSLVDIARQIVGSIVETFAKLNFINPILNNFFGGTTGFTLLPTAASAATSFGASGNSGEGNGGSLFNPTTWVTAGQKLWTGFTGGFSTFLNGTGGSFNWSMLSSRGYEAANLNNLNMSSVYGAPGGSTLGYGGYGSPWAQGLGVAAGLYAGYGRFQNRYNTLSGLAGGAAYGVGTYAVGAGLASAAGGAGFMAGAGALGPIGWAAIIAMGIDMLSGGKLFGTKGKLQGGSTTISIGDTGADIGGNLSFKGQKPLFGGTKWTNQSFDPGAEAHAAVDALYGKLRKDADAFANYFLTKGVVAAGSFWAEFDKKGKPTGKTTTTIGGYTFQDETQEQFIAREMAFSRIEILKAAGVSVTAYTDQFVKDADAFSQAVEDAAMAMQLAQQDIRKNALDISGGKGLQGAFDLANKWLDGADSLTETYQRLSAELTDVRNAAGLLTGQTTIEGIETFLRETRNVGETLTQTYQRLIQAAQQYRQFVGQFTPQVTYVDDFEASLAAVRAQLEANIKTANDLAKAAGLQGASAKDLANIYAASAKQAADLAKQLDIAMQSRAFALGVTTQGSLSDVQAEIQRLTSLRDAAQPVRDFGNAMQEAAQRATDAIGLLIGDRSPLKDRQKLEIARRGLMAGSVTQDQFLAIAERLFTKSTTAYDREFAFAQQFGARGGDGGSGGGGAGAGGKAFTAADQKRLDDLNKLLPQLEAANRLQEFRALAQQIAEMSQFTGDSWKKIVKDRGYDLAAIEKGLGLKNDEEFAAFIDKLQKQQDSNGQNTASIVAVLLKILGELQRQSNAREGGPQLPTGRGDNDRTLKQIGDTVGRSVGDALDRSGWRNRRAPEFPR